MKEEIQVCIDNVDVLLSRGILDKKELLMQVNSDLSSIYSIIDKNKINVSSLDVTSKRLGEVTIEEYYTTIEASLERLFKKHKIK